MAETEAEEIREIYETFRAWFAIQSQVRTFLLAGYCTVLGFAFTTRSSALAFISLLVVLASYMAEIRMRCYIAPFVYRALKIAPQDSALAEFIRTAYHPRTLAALNRDIDPGQRRARIRSALVFDLISQSSFTYFLWFLVTLGFFIYVYVNGFGKLAPGALD
jgi:hypothetical protein